MHGAFSANLDRPARVRFAVGKAGKPQGCLPARFPAGASGAQKRRAEKPQGRLYEFKPRILEEDKDMKQFVEMCFDPKSPMNDRLKKAIIEMLEGYAEYYSADLSEKVVRGMTENALKSKYNGGTLPIGYMIDSEQYFQLDPLTAPFVLEAFKRYAEGATMKEIRDYLNGQGVKNTRGQPLTYNSIQHLLNNRRYIGEYTYRDIVVPEGIPAIVPQDLFDRVQERLAKNRKAPARHKAEDDYLLTTKLFCGYCGAYLCGESGTSHTGNTHRYYKCVSVKKKRLECHKKSVRKEWIEDLVVNETMKMVMDDKAIEAIVSMQMECRTGRM